MKKAILILSIIFTLSASAQTDSVRTEALPEVVINSDGRIETAEKAVLLPTTKEKKHATNGFELLRVMQTTELEVSPRNRSITTHSGGEVVLLINGMEALPEDVATLRSKNIRSIEYVRTPSGKYAGKAGVINFITVKMEYGGNVYLSAAEGFAYKSGDYLAFVDFTKKRLTLSLTASADWTRDHNFTEGHDVFRFADNSTLTRDFTGASSLTKSDNEALRLKLTSTGARHRLNTYISLTRQSVPSAENVTSTAYSGKTNSATQRLVSSDSRNIAPTIYANYTLWLPKNNTLDITASASLGHNRYNSLYNETAQTAIKSAVTEDNNAIVGNVRYYKSWENGVVLSTTLKHNHNQYRDTYAGTSAGNQRLTTDVTMGLVQLNTTKEKYYYYLSAGVSNSAVALNGKHYNYCVPVAFYGGNYALNTKHSLSLSGLFTYTLFDPSNKNSMAMPTSFFETMMGNPDLAPMKVLGNTLAYNGQAGKSSFSLTYDSNIYFDNILTTYTVDNQTIFDTRTNDGTFYGNMLSATYALSVFADNLRLSATAIGEYNVLSGKVYDTSRGIFRMKVSATYLVGDWMMMLNYSSPYTSLDIREPFFLRRRPVYEMLVSWNHKALTIEALVRNPFSRYDKQHITMDYGCYNRNTWSHRESDGRNINLTLTYSFGYGKKHKIGSTDIEKNTNSANMRTY